MNKKIIKIVVIIVVIIVLLICLENMIRGFITVTEEVKTEKELKKEQELYEQTPQFQKEQYIEKSVQRTIDYIKSGDYEALYARVDPEYKDFMNFQTIEDFKKHIDAYLENPISVELVDYYKMYNKYVCTISAETSYGKKTHKVLVEDGSVGEFYVIFDYIDSIQTRTAKRYSKTINDVEFRIIHEVVYPDYKVYAVDITNNSDKTIEGTMAGSSIKKSDFTTHYFMNEDELNVSIPKGEKVRVNMKMDFGSSAPYGDVEVKLLIKDESGKSIGATLYVQAEYFEN